MTEFWSSPNVYLPSQDARLTAVIQKLASTDICFRDEQNFKT